MTHSRQVLPLTLVISLCMLLSLPGAFGNTAAGLTLAEKQGTTAPPFQIYLPSVLKPPPLPDLTRMVLIPDGVFPMGCDLNTIQACLPPDESPLHSVFLDAYYIDRFEVTTAEYKACETVGGCSSPFSVSSATRGFYYGNPAYANHPVIYATWKDADNYCRWAGKRLPTEAEWEKASRGTHGLRSYPWGNDYPGCPLTNFHYWIGITNNYYCVGDTTPVGDYPSGASPYGVMDMSGNVREWVQDWYLEDYYETSPSINPLGPGMGDQKVTRGGSWFDIWAGIRVASRSPQDPEMANSYSGIRCAYSTVQ